MCDQLYRWPEGSTESATRGICTLDDIMPIHGSGSTDKRVPYTSLSGFAFTHGVVLLCPTHARKQQSYDILRYHHACAHVPGMYLPLFDSD